MRISAKEVASQLLLILFTITSVIVFLHVMLFLSQFMEDWNSYLKIIVFVLIGFLFIGLILRAYVYSLSLLEKYFEKEKMKDLKELERR